MSNLLLSCLTCAPWWLQACVPALTACTILGLQARSKNGAWDTRAIAGGVVRAKHAELGALPQRNLLNVGHQIVGNAHRVLPNLACRHKRPSHLWHYACSAVCCMRGHQAASDAHWLSCLQSFGGLTIWQPWRLHDGGLG